MRKHLLAASLLGACPALAAAEPAQVAVSAPKPGARPTVAVLYFDYAGKDPGLSVLQKGLAQMLISDFAALPSVRVVERERLEAVLAEQKLARGRVIDSATAARLGKLLGARYLVLGSYFDLLGGLRADARLVEVETGRVIHSSGANGKPDDFMALEARLADELGHAMAALPPMQLASATPKAESDVRPDANAKATRPAPRHPAKLSTKTAVHYAEALDALDHGDKQKATVALQAVVKEQPDFQLAAGDLDHLMQ